MRKRLSVDPARDNNTILLILDVLLDYSDVNSVILAFRFNWQAFRWWEHACLLTQQETLELGIIRQRKIVHKNLPMPILILSGLRNILHEAEGVHRKTNDKVFTSTLMNNANVKNSGSALPNILTFFPLHSVRQQQGWTLTQMASTQTTVEHKNLGKSPVEVKKFIFWDRLQYTK